MSAAKFLQLLEDSGMLEKPLLAELRKQVSQSKTRVTAESIAKLLVDRGHLTRFQATRLVGQATADSPAAKEKEPPAKPKAPRPKDKKPPAKEKEEDLWLAPEDAKELGLPPKAEEEEDVILLEDASGGAEEVDGLTRVEDAGAGLTWVGQLPPGVIRPAKQEPDPLDLIPVGDAPSLPRPAPPPAPDPLWSLPSAPARGAPGAPPTPRKPKPRWESKLIYGGGFAFAILVFFGVILWMSLTRTPAIDMFKAAMADYRNEAYSEAIAKFEKFLEKYPRDENASEARIRTALARLRMAVGDPQRGLEMAQSVIPKISSETAFPIAREELAGILPQIPEGFLKQAKLTDDMAKAETLLTSAKKGMELVADPNVILTSVRARIDTTIKRIQEDMALVERAIDQDKELQKAIREITTAVEAKDTARAFEIYANLLKKYPALIKSQPLMASVRTISESERKLVKTESKSLTPTTADRPSIAESTVLLSSRSGTAGANPQKGAVVAIVASGTAFGLDLRTGQVLWRRFVGQGTTFQPTRVSDQPDADLLLVDSARSEILRCRAASGGLVWRVPVQGSLADPLIAGNRAYVATASGALWVLDLASGKSLQCVVFPQELRVAPAIAPNRPLAFQVGEHSNVYGISTDSLECQDVYYLGHKANAVDVRPLVLQNHVFVVENAGSDFSLLHSIALASGEKGMRLEKAQDPVRLSGNVRVPMVVLGRRLLVLTDRGEIRVFDVDVTDAKEPLKDVAKLPPMHDQPVIGYPVTEAMSLWVADDRLTNYQIQVTTKQINRNPSIGNVGDTFVAPLQLVENVLVHVRRVKDSTGVTVAAVTIDNLRKPIWETQLAAPLVHATADATKHKISVVSSNGSLFELDPEQLARGLSAPPVTSLSSAETPLAFTNAFAMDGGRVAVFNPVAPQHLLTFDPSASPAAMKRVALKLGGGEPSGAPTLFQGGLLVPTKKGDILLLDTASGEDKVLPFRPRLEPDQQVNWVRPAVLGDPGREIVAADDRRQIFRIGVKDDPKPFLAELGNAALDFALTGALAAAGDTVYGVARSGSADVIVAISPSELKILKEWDLEGGRVTWGPERLGNLVLVCVDGRRWRCFESGQKEHWQKPSTGHGMPTGLPLKVGGDFVFSSVDGVVWRISESSGQEVGKVELGEPLGNGPWVYGDKLLLGGVSGTLFVVPIPAGS